MKLAELFKQGRPVFSFEVFPPKRDKPIDTIYSTLDALKDLKPDFISVTYGASGSLADNSTCEIASAIKHKYGMESAAHLTCVNSTREEVKVVLERLKAAGVENILALRGDISPDVPPKDDFHHASELIEYIKSLGYDFGISGACYPEGHPNSESQIDDIVNLKKKVDAGAQHLVSQLFFDNSIKKQIERMVSMCGASLPPKFAKTMSRYETRPDALKDAGIAYAAEQIVDLVSQGVDGIHLYTMNNPEVARRINDSVRSLF